MIIYPYNSASESAKKLAAALGIKRAKHEGGAIKTTVINWGASSFGNRAVQAPVINSPAAVADAINKLSTFKILKDKGVATPDFTESAEEANKWLAEGVTVVARTKLTGHSGEGIVIVDPDSGEKLPAAKLYTKYVPKTDEFRIHVFQGKPFFLQRKARNKDVADDKVNWKVRNHANGFIFAHKDVALNKVGSDLAVAAVTALELDFGAVDIIYNKTKNKFFVLEVNTACGLEGTTLDKYVEVFKGIQ